MNSVFADTSYYLALLNPRDAWHAAANHWSHAIRCPVVLTEFVLLELGNSLTRGNDRRLFVDLRAHLQSDAATTVAPLSHELFDLGCDVFAHRPDKDWSLTDCISFVVMRERKLTQALTADHHFEQAGFSILLK